MSAVRRGRREGTWGCSGGFLPGGEEWGLEGAWGREAVSLLDFILVFKKRNDTQRLVGRICRG